MSAQVKCGTSATPMAQQYVGRTVSDLRAMLAPELGISPDAPAVVSHRGGTPTPVKEGYTLQDGDLLEFVRSPGAKGRRYIRVAA